MRVETLEDKKLKKSIHYWWWPEYIVFDFCEFKYTHKKKQENVCMFWNRLKKSTYLSSYVCLWSAKIGTPETETNKNSTLFVNFSIVITGKWHYMKINNNYARRQWLSASNIRTIYKHWNLEMATICTTIWLCFLYFGPLWNTTQSDLFNGRRRIGKKMVYFIKQ